MRNLRPQEFAPANPAWVTAPFDYTLDWPFPQVVRGEDVTLLLKRAAASTLDAAWDETALTVKQSDDRASNATVTGGGVWHAATFEDNWFATNATDFLFKTAAHAQTCKATGLTVQTLCAHNDRLILAGLAGDWFSGDRWLRLFKRWRETQPRFSHDQMSWSTRWVVWCERDGGANDTPFWPLLAALGVFGNDAFDALEANFLKRVERGEMGFTSIRSLGTPQAVLPLGSGSVVYSKERRVRLTPAQAGSYDLERIPGPGVVNRGGLCGDEAQHAWITPKVEAYADRPGSAPVRLRQGHRFTGSLTNLCAAFDSEEREHRFSTENWSYVLNDYGWGGPLDQRVTSLGRADGVLIGAGENLEAETLPVELYSHLADFGNSDSKSVHNIEVIQEGLTSLKVDVEASDEAEAPYSLGVEQANEHGVGYITRAGNKFQIGAQGTGTVGADYAIQRIVTRYQRDSRRHRRGAGNLSGATSSE
jgi:hypothetical protein